MRYMSGMWGAPPEVKKRARIASIINLFTFVGGWFWAGHWIIGLAYCGGMFIALLTIFIGIGFILVPMLWLSSIIYAYVTVVQSSLQRTIWSQSERESQQNYIDNLGESGEPTV